MQASSAVLSAEVLRKLMVPLFKIWLAATLAIPRSRDKAELRWGYDTEIVSNLIAVITLFLGHFLAQESQHRRAELPKGGVALVVGDVPVHQAP